MAGPWREISEGLVSWPFHCMHINLNDHIKGDMQMKIGIFLTTLIRNSLFGMKCNANKATYLVKCKATDTHSPLWIFSHSQRLARH